jgi:hypothetical protein
MISSNFLNATNRIDWFDVVPGSSVPGFTGLETRRPGPAFYITGYGLGLKQDDPSPSRELARDRSGAPAAQESGTPKRAES